MKKSKYQHTNKPTNSEIIDAIKAAKPVLTAGGFTKQNFNHGQTY